jgi:N-dimethylarginine dimethylaminohydrolase
MGDAIWHGTKRLLWGGYGFRTSINAYEIIAKAWKVPVIAVELTDPDFYHIDTCFTVLNNNTVLIYPGAFKPEGLEMIRELFSDVIESPETEARKNMACNAFCPDTKNVIIQAGSNETNGKLKEKAFNVIEVDTSEFIKGGGSVFCMKMMTW